MMRIIRKQWSAGRAIVTIAAACLFLMQTMAAGVAAGASVSGADAGLLKLICFSDNAGGVSKGDSQTPSRQHHAGACCILHNEAAVEPDAAPATVVSFIPTPPKIVGLSTGPLGAIHDAPEMGPRSARAPPAYIA